MLPTHIFILVVPELSLAIFQELLNFNYISDENLSMSSSVVMIVMFIYMILQIIYLAYRTKKKVLYEIQEEIFSQNTKNIVEQKMAPGFTASYKLIITFRKIFCSIAVVFFYNYPIIQSWAIFTVYCLYFGYLLKFDPVKYF